MSDLLFVLQIVIETSFFSYWEIHKLMQDFVKGSLNSFTDKRLYVVRLWSNMLTKIPSVDGTDSNVDREL